MGRVGPIHDFDWRDGSLFVGNQLVLDFLNTCPVQNGEPMELLSDFSALLRWFQAAELLSAREVENLQRRWGKSGRAQRTVEAVRELRERLRKEILAWEHGGAVHHSTVAELKWKRVLDGAVVRNAPTRRPVCPSGARHDDVVRQCGSQPCPQV